MSRILIIGDSVAHGFYDLDGACWVDRLKKYCEQKKEDVTIFTISINSATTKELVQRFEAELGPRLPFDVALFAVGIHDSHHDANLGVASIAAQAFVENVRRLSETARKYCSTIIFIGLTPVDESRTVPCPWTPHYSYFKRTVEQYDSLLRVFCSQNRLLYVPVNHALTFADLDDGLHPTSEGHRKLFELITGVLEREHII